MGIAGLGILASKQGNPSLRLSISMYDVSFFPFRDKRDNTRRMGEFWFDDLSLAGWPRSPPNIPHGFRSRRQLDSCPLACFDRLHH